MTSPTKSTAKADPTPADPAVPALLGTAHVQDPNGPDQLDANNTGRVGDAREYDAETAAAAAAAKPTEGFLAGQTAPSTKYADLEGVVTDTAGEGFRGSIVIVKGDVVNTAQAAQLAG